MSSHKCPQVHTPAPTPSRAIYGLALYIGCRALFMLYLFWALVPDEWLEFFGFDFLPSKYWVVALPVLACVYLAFTAFLLYPGLGIILTPSREEAAAFTHNSDHFKKLIYKSFPSQAFVPTSQVCKIIHQQN